MSAQQARRAAERASGRLGVLWAATKTKEQANERSRDATQTAISVPAIRSEDANAPGYTFRLALRWDRRQHLAGERCRKLWWQDHGRKPLADARGDATRVRRIRCCHQRGVGLDSPVAQ